MEDFREQYRQELKHQEIKSNKRTLKGFNWFFMAIALIWLLTVTGFFEVDKTLISIAFLSTIILFIPAVSIYFKSDLSKLWIKYLLLSLICIVSAVIAAFLSFHAVLVYVVPLLFAIQYRRRSTIWFVYAANTVTMLISSLVSFYYGICDLNLLLQSQHVRSWYLEIITEGALNIPFNENPVFIIIVFEVFPRSIILFVFSIMMQYTIVSSNEDAYRIAQLTYLKETDTKTKVFNKNKYVEMVENYYPGIGQISVLFWDLNNLKKINDKYGHAMGDMAIETLSSALSSHSSDRCRVYRIGGDEFLMIIDDPEREESESVIRAVQEALKKSHADYEVKVSSAVGFALGKGSDILEVVKAADIRMYENKKKSKEGGER
ncbi:MAG: GGDEF domain-containing protein [Candidatus Gastranaerophilales bacterium]|nr:GGDEF domain-containing protein [Candidatus Gastranaerophilales bacterium]